MSDFANMLPRLRLSANQAIWAAWHAAHLHQGTPNEVACIKNLVEVALPRIDAVWRRALDPVGMRARMQGVVCHGHPWVRYAGAPARCELGDFLLVHDHRSGSGSLKRRAVIVQAKVFHPTGVRARNSVQLELYKKWPRFNYESWPGGINNLASVHAAAGLTGRLGDLRERDLTITAPSKPPASSVMLDEGCRYGMIDVKHSRWGNPLTGMNPWRLCSARAHDVYTSQAGFTLGSYLVRLVAGQVGRHVPVIQWPDSMAAACHWSLLVKELLSILPSATPPSGGSIVFLAATPNLNIETRGRLGPRLIPEAETGDGAFGIIRVQTSGDIGGLPLREDEPGR